MLKNKIKPFNARNNLQLELARATSKVDLILAHGPAGSGKTFAAVGLALEHLTKGKVEKIIVARPAVTNDEKLGFLPGDLEEKIDPYLMPIWDSFEEFMSIKDLESMIQDRSIRAEGIGFLRGRTFSNAFIIIDEAQNTTISQMKMLLTRFGEGVKCVIDGDLRQSDIGEDNGLKWAIDKLTTCPAVKILSADNKDVIRSKLVAELIDYLD